MKLSIILLLLPSLFINKAAALNLEDSDNVDIKRMFAIGVLDSENIKSLNYRIEEFRDSQNLQWTFRIINSTEDPTPVFFAPHNDEKEAFDTGVKFITKHHRGTIVNLLCNNKRYCNNLDPNRYFCNVSFANKVFSFLPTFGPIITLHNNEKGSVQGKNGLGNISINFPLPRTKTYARNTENEDDMVIHVGENPPELMSLQLHQFLAQAQLNELYELYSTKYFECSMSYEAHRRNLFYVNIETQKRSPEDANYGLQLDILEKVLSWMNSVLQNSQLK
ncbi:MAG: hypothetical protein L6Q37_09755 [Bdellovibrionaceae bacterium]|nr:hypothetical protein [Pseudobdellovibrionaceae bacterium]NUM57428.1 hypothetical protein [Pseudobdellovibrionaceae bacterium]